MKNCIWMVDSSILNPIFDRVKSFLPPTIYFYGNTYTLHGLNGRFRFYEYEIGDYFTEHTDGSWPGKI